MTHFSRPVIADSHQADTLISLFNPLFVQSHRTTLEGGGEEPFYRPATGPADWNRIIFTRDYFASALHEVAHWCIAGPQRRRQPDYGYWYAPDGRDRQQQRAFEQVEVKPQALEWVFSRAAGFRFRLSADNLGGSAGPSTSFKQAVWEQVCHYCRAGLPPRAARFAEAVAASFGISDALDISGYRMDELE